MDERPPAHDDLHVHLAPPRPDDADAFVAGVIASRALHHPWSSPPATAEAFATWIERVDDLRQSPRLVRVSAASASAGDPGAIAGAVNLSETIRGPLQQCFVGWYALAGWTGRGIMTRALALALDHAFAPRDAGGLGLHRVEANIQPGNEASRRLARRAGFRLEGFSPRYLRVAGDWRDHERWAILADEPRPAAVDAPRPCHAGSLHASDPASHPAAHDHTAAPGRDVTVAELLDVAARTAEQRFRDEPALLADVTARIGVAHERLGRHDEAVRLLETSLAAAERAGLGPEATLAIEFALAEAMSYTRERHREGLERAADVHERALAALGPEHRTTILSAVALDITDESAEDSVARMTDALRRLELLGEGDAPEALRVMDRLAVGYERLGREGDRRAMLERVAALTEERLGPDHSRSIGARVRLAEHLAETGEAELAIPMVEDALARAARTFDEDHMVLRGMRFSAIRLLTRLDAHDPAIAFARTVDEQLLRSGQAESIFRGLAMHELAVALVARGAPGDAAEALAITDEAIPLRAGQWGETHGSVLATHAVRALALVALADTPDLPHADATGHRTRALADADADRVLERMGPGSTTHRCAVVARVRALVGLGRLAEAATTLDTALAGARESGNERAVAAFTELAPLVDADG